MPHSNHSQPSLRDRMKLDMTLAGFTDGSQQTYLNAVDLLERHYGQSAEELTEVQLQQYALYLRNEKKVAKGTFQGYWGALKLLYTITLDRDWPLFTKKKWPIRDRSVCHGQGPTSSAAS